MTIVVVTPPAGEPIDLAAAKLHLRVDDTADDALITSLITAARAMAETELHRYLMTQTLDLYLDHFPIYTNPRFPDRDILLPPVQSVTSIVYTDTDGTELTLDPSLYRVDAMSQPARIAAAWGYVWPPTRRQSSAVKVRFVAGYGAAVDVPECIKNWMLLKIGTMYENREQVSIGQRLTLAALPDRFIDGLLDPERVSGRI